MKNINYTLKVLNLINFVEEKEKILPRTLGHHYNRRQTLVKYIKGIKDKVFNGYRFDNKKYIKILVMIETVYLLPLNI